MNRPSEKLHFIQCSTIIVCIIFIIRLSYFQIYCQMHYKKQSEKNFIRHETITPLRGSIRDCNGVLLATNRPVTDLYWKSTGNTGLSSQQDETLLFLQSILHRTFRKTEYQRITQAERTKKKYLIARDISIEQICALSEQLIYHTNIVLKTKAKRLYPYNEYGAHTIGYINRTNTEGKMGLESICNATLSGIPGTIQKTVNSRNIILNQKQISEPISGFNITTTLDIHIQQIAEQLFENMYTGTCIVIDPCDGAIKALVSRPSFDPNIFLQPISHRTWQELQKNSPFINRACNATYPPGSLFKLITISAALEQDIIKPHTTWLCPGYTVCGNRKYWCNRRWGHGTLSTTQAIAQSCNILFYEIGKKIDIDILARYAFFFGLGQKTGICISEKTGLMPTRNWKIMAKGERWWQGETVSVAIGQSFLLVTPMQIARMIGSIFTGYLVTPRLVNTEPIKTHKLAISSQTRIFLQESMRSVVTRGTGRRINTVEDIVIFAKTSTAQVSTLKKSSTDSQYSEHGWFAGYFQYKDKSPLVLVLLIEHAGSSRVPTVMAKNFLISYKNLIDRS